MPTYRIALLVAMAALLCTFPGAPQEASGQSGETQVFQSVESSLELTRSERRRIQMGLAAEGFDPGPTDGLFGRGTRSAIRTWQGSRGKAATGYLDAEAARALLTAGEQREAESAVKQQYGHANVERVNPANEILRDKYVLGLSQALKADDYPRALAYIDKLQELGGDLPPSVDYFRGEAYFNTKRYSKAGKALNHYVSKVGKNGRYYRKSLELLLATEEEIRELLKGLNEKDKDGYTALYRAAREKDHELVTELIALGADVDAWGKYGYTPLYAAAKHNAREVASLLIEAGADVNAPKGMRTPLHLAARGNAPDVAKLLIGAGADVNAKDKDGWTPLHHAALENAGEVAALLIKADADVNATSKLGTTPLGVAANVKNAREVAALIHRHGGRE